MAVRVQDDGCMTWEPKENLSEDLLRDFEESFWQACKTADMDVLEPALRYGSDTMSNIVDASQRSPLHYAAALNKRLLIERLLDAGAPITSMHLTCLHTNTDMHQVDAW
jgi:signal recognition particle 43 kDa protein